MSQITVDNLSFYYDGSYDMIFEEVSFQIDTDWRLGFVGRNGRGKTTFLKLLMGEYEYRGTIAAPVKFEYFPYPVSDKEKDTILIVEEVYPEYELWRLFKELNLLEVSEDILYRPFSTLSNGEQTKVLLAVLFLKENHFLLIDEPTNHLDQKGRLTVCNYLKGKKGFILVSHDRYFLDHCVDHILAINKTNLEVMQGDFSIWWEQKKNQDEYEYGEKERLKKDIKKLTEAAKRTEGWSDQVEKSKIGQHSPDRGHIGHKAAKMMKRAKSVETRAKNAVEEKSKLLKNVEKADDLKLYPLHYHKNTMVRLEGVSLYYEDRQVCRQICQEINLEVANGQRIVLEGGNGSGKSTLLKKLLGEEIAAKGRIEIGSGLMISQVPQDASFLKGSLSAYAKEHDLEESLLKAILRQLDFSRVQFDKDMESYSGGQKKKVLIAGSLCERAHLYLWDEPLNFVDIFSRMQIEKLIMKYSPSMIFVEHDKVFSDKIATDRIIMG